MAIGNDVGRKLRLLRQRSGIGVRALAERAGVTPAMVSYVENDKASCSVVTLEKLLDALGTDMAAFFGAETDAPDGPVVPREVMRLVADEERNYTVLFPPAAGLGVEVLDELLQPAGTPPDFERRHGTTAGYVIAGEMTLEVQDDAPRTLRPGDAFHVPAAVSHRGYCAGGEPVRLITLFIPETPRRKRPITAKGK